MAIAWSLVKTILGAADRAAEVCARLPTQSIPTMSA